MFNAFVISSEIQKLDFSIVFHVFITFDLEILGYELVWHFYYVPSNFRSKEILPLVISLTQFFFYSEVKVQLLFFVRKSISASLEKFRTQWQKILKEIKIVDSPKNFFPRIFTFSAYLFGLFLVQRVSANFAIRFVRRGTKFGKWRILLFSAGVFSRLLCFWSSK